MHVLCLVDICVYDCSKECDVLFVVLCSFLVVFAAC